MEKILYYPYINLPRTDWTLRSLLYYESVGSIVPNMIEGTELFNERLRELRMRKEELAAKMNESKFGNILFGTVCGLIGAIQGLSAAETPGALIGALPGFASAVHSALTIERAEDIFDQSGLKYLALADKRLRRYRGRHNFWESFVK